MAKGFSGRLGDADIRLLRVFRAVVEAGGFTQAEAALGVTRSTISTQMADLEQRLGMRLCRRGRGGFALTDDGLRAYRAAVRALAALEDFRAEISAAHDRLAGELNFAFVDGTTGHPECRMAETLRRYGERAPGVFVNIHIVPLDEIERGVLDGRFHLGLIPVYRTLSGLAYRRLFDEDHALYCGRLHPLFDAADSDEEAIAACPYVGRSYLDENRFRRGYPPMKPAALAHHMESAAAFILSGRFVGVLPTHYAEQWARTGEMRALAPERTGYRNSFHAVTRAGALPSPVTQAFLDELLAVHEAG